MIISTGNHIEPEYDFYGVVTLKGVDRSVLIEIIKKKLPSTVSILSLNTPISQQGREKDAIMSEIRKNQ
ncbi:MAG: hypothetical protein OEV93_04720 [Candidatus Moranbacteria bacterium]|nr:hypothetical protein [Candidatus Moranbacteria bacterium]